MSVVEDRPIMSVNHCLPVLVFYFWRKLLHTLQRGLSAIAEHLVWLCTEYDYTDYLILFLKVALPQQDIANPWGLDEPAYKLTTVIHQSFRFSGSYRQCWGWMVLETDHYSSFQNHHWFLSAGRSMCFSDTGELRLFATKSVYTRSLTHWVKFWRHLRKHSRSRSK